MAARKVSNKDLPPPEPETRKYFASDDDLPELFFKSQEQIEEEAWEEAWTKKP